MTEQEISDKIMTVPTVISAAGLGLVQDGLRRGIDTPEGLIETLIAKLLDNVDGAFARHVPDSDLGRLLVNLLPFLEDRLGTSHFGAKADPIIDRLTNAEIAIAAWKANSAPKTVLAIIALLELAKVTATSVDAVRNPQEFADRRPSKSGKIGTFAHAAATFSFAAEHIMPEAYKTPKIIIRALGWTAFAAGVAYNTHATAIYTRRAMRME